MNQFRVRHSDGHYLHILARALVVRRQEDGRVVRLIGTNTNISDLIHTQQKLEDRTQFETLISDISSSFINLPASLADSVINAGLEKIARYLNAERGAIIFFAEPPLKSEVQYEWAGDELTPVSEAFKTVDFDELLWIKERVKKNEPVILDTQNDIPEESVAEQTFIKLLNMKSIILSPMAHSNRVIGLIGFDAIEPKTWDSEMAKRLRLLADVFTNAIIRKQSDDEINHLKQQLEEENLYLQEEINLSHGFNEIIGEDDTLKRVLQQAEQVATTNTTVLINGESGTGKELIARALHNLSQRKDRPLIKVNCAALSQTLLESELFGHEKGAFTGATRQRKGRFELADGGTLFLDEVGELALDLQGKLLRVLQEGEFERVGGNTTLKVDVRILTATNRHLDQAVKAGTFREDLYYRLNVFPLVMPELRERSSDIPRLVNHFTQHFAHEIGREITEVSPKSMKRLTAYHWPGNVRELRNVIERSVIISPGPVLVIDESLLNQEENVITERKTLAEMEHDYILQILENTNWKIEGKNGAAERLGLNPGTLRGRLRKLGIHRPGK